MPYVVTHVEPKSNVPSLAQMLSGENHPLSHKSRLYPGTVTRYCDKVNGFRPEDVRRLISALESYAHTAACYPKSLGGQYRIFSIPKQSGGMRKICEPKPRLYADQIALRQLLEQDFFALQHTSAFAYCKGRNIKNCIQRHQANQSKWFLKLDFEDFFGSTSLSFVLSQLEKISPFSEVMADAVGKRRLTQALSICFLDDGLPQGTPISPMLTNLVMIPFDHILNKKLHALGFVYTRYADDIQISHKRHFKPERVIKIVQETLTEVGAPYHLKTNKTRYGSSSGRNFNLGLMLNGNNNITIGHKQHKLLKARLHSFAMDTKSGKKWSSQEASKLLGQLAYFESIEPDTAAYMVKHLSTKLNMNVYVILKHAATDPLAFAYLLNTFAA